MPGRLRRLLPRTFQGRLTGAFLFVVTLTLALVTVLVINRLDDYFTSQQRGDLDQRSKSVETYVTGVADAYADGNPVVGVDGHVDSEVLTTMADHSLQRFIADRLGQADVQIAFGRFVSDGETKTFVPAVDAPILLHLEAPPAPGQTQEKDVGWSQEYGAGDVFTPYALRVTLSNPYTCRATALANATGLLAAIALFALGLSVFVSALMARRFTTPLRRLTEASRGLAEGDLTRRVPPSELRAGSSELSELAVQFNAMADRLQESVEIIRRDRDRSRDFLADVSHELRTPLAALRTFNELLTEGAADDPEARAEFLESSGQQIKRLDWLAQNLLELSKLDSGLVLLDLRPDDLRATVESAVEQNRAAAKRRGVELPVAVPDRPLRIRYDPLRIGQVVTNLVGNAIKFTPPSGSVAVTVRPNDAGAEIDVRDTGVGIDASELPRIFDRFYRGSRANEARGSGSGLGLAIVRSIVEMHNGTVVVESRLGAGSRFIVTLPRDPRAEDAPAPPAAEPPAGRAAAPTNMRAAVTPHALQTAKVADSSPRDSSQLNPEASP